MCANNADARPDVLPDEPGGYTGFQALFGAKYVDPAITAQQPCVPDTAGQPITDPAGTCGFPGFDGMLARNTLGYVEQMQENGVPVTYGYISDVHDAHTPNPATDSYVSTATGPGEAAHEAQLKDYDDAFAAFFQNLAAHGIDKSNTLFVITVDEGDHFAGGAGIPQPDGTLQYAHTACATLTACPSNQIGEVNANIQALLPAGEPAFSVHSDDAPTVYVSGHPGPTDPAVRKLERDVAGLQAPDPYVGSGSTVPLMVNLADPVEEQALHMVNTDSSRTPTFTLFGNDDFFFTTSDPSFGSPNQCAGVHLCAVPSFAWNHGDVQEQIGNTWAGLVGPGVAHRGIDSRDVDGSHQPAPDHPGPHRAQGRLPARRARARRGVAVWRDASRAPVAHHHAARRSVRAAQRAVRPVRAGHAGRLDPGRRERLGDRRLAVHAHRGGDRIADGETGCPGTEDRRTARRRGVRASAGTASPGHLRVRRGAAPDRPSARALRSTRPGPPPASAAGPVVLHLPGIEAEPGERLDDLVLLVRAGARAASRSGSRSRPGSARSRRGG